jgi:hypothetical protein
MRFVTVKHQDNENCIRLVHLRDRNWQPEDIPESLMRDLFDDWDDHDEANDNEFFKALTQKTLSL